MLTKTFIKKYKVAWTIILIDNYLEKIYFLLNDICHEKCPQNENFKDKSYTILG